MSLALWIWALVDVIKRDDFEGNNKIIWLLVVILLQGFGAIIYYFAGRKKVG